MKLAYIELEVAAKEKAKIYDSLFTKELIVKIKETEQNNKLKNELSDIKSKKEVLVLLRQKLSIVTIGDFKLIHIKDSKFNSNFEKIARIIINK